MSLFAQKLKTPNRRADEFGVFHASQAQKSQLLLASKTNNSTLLELKTTSITPNCSTY